jgi:pSer/pThr/pTyr-binding forkhead associated (FHA) protein
MKVNLVRFTKDGTVKSFELPSSVTVIGRRGDCDLRIPLSSVSRRHCQINTNENILRVLDLDSKNGIVVNGKEVKEAQLNAGDTLQIGPLTFIIQIDGKPENPSLPLTEAAKFKKNKRNKLKKSKEEDFELPQNKDKAGLLKDEFLGLDDLEEPDGDSSTQINNLEQLD